jgi:NADP-dependent aldehyde dehydrogenase
MAPDLRAGLLEAIAEELLTIGADLVETAMQESGLPKQRLEGELARTMGQLRLFATTVRRGDWLDIVIERALPDRKPASRSDLRRFNLALGPVAVFGASNFPLAFSVAGGDTASALAAGCPVIVKGHPAHPATGELAARAIIRAVDANGLPDGVFSYLPGPDFALGEALVTDPRIKAVGFTGSRSGGLVLQALAAGRSEPIPVFAEMSSVNPVVILPGALAADPNVLAAAYVQSLCLGAGQFCTNPGLTFAVAGPNLDLFITSVVAKLAAVPPALMLTPAIKSTFEAEVDRLEASPGVRTMVRGSDPHDGTSARPSLFVIKGTDFSAGQELSSELFGPAGLIIECADVNEMARLIFGLEGQLTATLHFATSDHQTASELLPVLVDRAGRVLANGWPTGVEVCEAMVHGGPYPSTTDGGRSTSVGALAMQRFVRPICYQDLPSSLLPSPIRDDNPWRVPRRVDGCWERAV